MKTLIAFTVLIALRCINAELNLQGKLGEYIGLPVSLYCAEYDYGYLRLGGITLNNAPLSEQDQDKASKQCEVQMKKIEQARKHPVREKKGTECVLTFPGLKVNETDVIRTVYNCYETKPSGSPAWGKDKDEGGLESYETVETRKNEMLPVVCKKKNELIFIIQAKINEENIDASAHPDLDATTLTQRCFGQWKEVLDDGTAKLVTPTCKIMNEKKYGGKLTIVYSCISEGKQRKEVGSKARKS